MWVHRQFTKEEIKMSYMNWERKFNLNIVQRNAD